jgi:hypothetical protein
MKRLTRLELSCMSWPRSLSRLTGLQHLVVRARGSVDFAGPFLREADAALQCLTGLTALLLSQDCFLQGGSMPASIARLPHLQRLCYLAQDAQLPPGPYSTSLRVLGASMWSLHNSCALLASCSVLEHVGIRGDCQDTGPFWQWAEQHPSLRRVQARLSLRRQPEPQPLALLRAARPQLQVDVSHEWDEEPDSFLPLFKWQDEWWANRNVQCI